MSGQVTDWEHEELARAQHQTWHIGCKRECGGRLDDAIKSASVIEPVVARLWDARESRLRAQIARDIRAELDRWVALSDARPPFPLHSEPWLVQRAYESAASIATSPAEHREASQDEGGRDE